MKGDDLLILILVFLWIAFLTGFAVIYGRLINIGRRFDRIEHLLGVDKEEDYKDASTLEDLSRHLDRIESELRKLRP